MNKLGLGVLSSCAMIAGCPQSAAPPHRAEIRQLTGNSAQIIPTAGQLPYCLVFTTSASGLIRQLTMSHDDRSIECPADRPIGGVRYRFPVDEGRVRILVLFSDRKLDAGSVAEQIVEKGSASALSATDLRLPGRANSEVLEFTPALEREPALGTVIGRSPETGDGGRAVDAGR